MATVMLDAGHGGYDQGASFDGRKEKEDVLNLTLAVGSILEDAGVDVLYTRTTDVYQSPQEKVDIANRSDADYFISIHRNSSVEPETYSGVQTLVYRDEGIPALFSENINQELEKTGFTNLGTSVRPNLAVLRRTTMPAALLEVGFINTGRDNEIFDLKFPEVARAIANGILNTVEGAALQENSIEEYSVEVGIFMHYENARNLAEHMQADGFSAKIQPRHQCFQVLHGRFDSLDKARLAERELFQNGYETRVIHFEDSPK